jgi:4-diphosphocytidyl-2-C-methyl-D-erythritol kinase
MFGAGLGRRALEELGGAIGSDVPFCVSGGTSLAEGKGEILTDLPPLPECHILICKPPFACSTPEIFGRVRCEKIRARPDTGGIVDALGRSDLSNVARRMYNVLEDVLPRGVREIAGIKHSMFDEGALGSAMTGSGPAVIGLFDNDGQARRAYERLRLNYKECFLTETVERLGFS